MARYTAAMINIRPLTEARVRSQVATLKEVAGASDLSSILKGRLADLGCYLFLERVSPDKNASAVGLVQEVTLQMAAVIVVRNVRDARGSDAADASHDLQTSIQAALLNWSPHADYQAFSYAGGSLVSFAGGFYIWRDSFATKTFIQY